MFISPDRLDLLFATLVASPTYDGAIAFSPLGSAVAEIALSLIAGKFFIRRHEDSLW